MFYRENVNDDFGKKYLKSIPEPNVIARAMCLSEEVKIPMINAIIDKDSFGIFVVIIDFLVILTILIYICILEQRQDEYIKAFKDKSI